VNSCVLSVIFLPLCTLFSTVALEQSSGLSDSPTTHPDLVLQVGHTKPISALAFSPDGKWLASGSDDLTIKIWDLATGSVVRTIQSSKHITTLAISPDAKLLAAGEGASNHVLSLDNGGEYAIVLWDVATGRKLRTFGAHAFSIQGMVFSRDGRELSSVSGDAIKKWDVSTGAAKTSFAIDYGKHRDVLGGMAQAVISPDGRLAGVAGYDKPFKIYDAATGNELVNTGIKANNEATMTFSADGQLVAFLLGDRAIIRELRGPDLHVLAAGTAAFHAKGNLVFSPDGRTLVTLRPAAGVVNGGEAKVWDVSSGALVRAIATVVSNGRAPLASFSPDGQNIAEIVGNGIRLVNLRSGADQLVLSSQETVPFEETDAYRFYMNNPKAIAYLKKNAGISTPEEIKAYFESHQDQLAAMMARVSSEGASLPADYRATDAFTFSPDGRWLVYRRKQMKSTRTEIWSTSTGVPARDADFASLSLIGQPGLSPDGRFRAGPPDSHDAGAAFKRALSTFSPVQPNPNKDPFIYPSEIDLFDAKSNAKLHAFSAGKSDDSRFTPAFGFSSDGEEIAFTGFNKAHVPAIFVYQTTSGKQIAELPGRDQIKNLSASAKGDVLAVGNGTQVELLDVHTGASLRKLATQDGAQSLAFSTNGRILAIGDNSGSQELWDVASGNKLATLVNLVGVLGGESKEWLVVAPDGLFDGSPGAWGHILWRFSGQTFDVAPVELFFNEFYYPGLLADILHGKRPKASHDISTKDRRQPHLTLTTADGPSSTSSPVSTRVVKLALSVANAPAGARDVRLFRNGSLVKVWRDDVLRGASNVTVEATVPIIAGQNKFRAYAFNQDNIKSQDVVLTIEGAETLKRAAVLYAVTVGINTYANAEYSLKYAAADAQSFGEEVRRQQMRLSKFSRVEVANLSDQDATKANILLALKILSGIDAGASRGSASPALQNLSRAQPEDAVIVYYAGHGTAQQSRFYLIPHDLGYNGERGNLDEAGMQTILQHSISDQEIAQALEEVDAGQLLLVIDACNSGQALEAEEKRRGPMNSKGLAQLAYEKGMDILTAAQSYQAALEAAQLGHGYLTYALVEEGLKTNAADIAPKDGQVEVREWIDYATGRVPQMQEMRIKELLAKRRELTFVEGEERGDNAERQQLQRPRAFYRRELQSQPFIVARPEK